MTRKAVFLDRDGVLNRAISRDGKTYPPANAEEMEILPEAAEAVDTLRAAGYTCVCVTNQPDVARGTRTLDNVLAMNEKVRQKIRLDDLYYCPHDNGDNCPCRKPKPGMLLQAADKWGIDLAASWMVGDRGSDILAGAAAGCRTILVTPSPEAAASDPDGVKPDAYAVGVLEAAGIILGAAPRGTPGSP